MYGKHLKGLHQTCVRKFSEAWSAACLPAGRALLAGSHVASLHLWLITSQLINCRSLIRQSRQLASIAAQLRLSADQAAAPPQSTKIILQFVNHWKETKRCQHNYWYWHIMMCGLGLKVFICDLGIVHFGAVKHRHRHIHLQAVKLSKSASFPCNLSSTR